MQVMLHGSPRPARGFAGIPHPLPEKRKKQQMAEGGDRPGHQKSFTFSKIEQEGKKKNKGIKKKKKS